MRVLIFLILISWIYTSDSYSQDSSRVSFSISTNTTQYFVLDFPMILEKYYGRHTMGLLLSFRPATVSSGNVEGGKGPIFGEYVFQNYINNLYNAATIGLNSKYFLSHKNNAYIDAQIFSRYWWFNSKQAVYENVEGGYTFNGLRTEKQNILGFKLLFGRTIEVGYGHRVKPVMNLYIGIGARYKTFRFETVEGVVDDEFYNYKLDTWSIWTPSLEFGMTIGLGVMRKK